MTSVSTGRILTVSAIGGAALPRRAPTTHVEEPVEDRVEAEATATDNGARIAASARRDRSLARRASCAVRCPWGAPIGQYALASGRGDPSVAINE